MWNHCQYCKCQCYCVCFYLTPLPPTSKYFLKIISLVGYTLFLILTYLPKTILIYFDCWMQNTFSFIVLFLSLFIFDWLRTESDFRIVCLSSQNLVEREMQLPCLAANNRFITLDAQSDTLLCPILKGISIILLMILDDRQIFIIYEIMQKIVYFLTNTVHMWSYFF